MLEVITKPNSLWVADFCFLTRRMPKKFHDFRKYKVNHIPRPRGNIKIDIGENVVFVPKWIRWNYDTSQFNKWDRHEYKPSNRIKIYDRPIVLFAVQDVASRFIIHAHLKESPKEFVNRSYGYPYWFNLDECFKTALTNLPFPCHNFFALDAVIHRVYSKKILSWNWNWEKETIAINDSIKFLGSTLEGFFSRLQYEFREDLTQKNLDKWIHYWNYERDMPALKHKSPSSIYYPN